jgi:hypothetical protein
LRLKPDFTVYNKIYPNFASLGDFLALSQACEGYLGTPNHILEFLMFSTRYYYKQFEAFQNRQNCPISDHSENDVVLSGTSKFGIFLADYQS